MRDRTVFRRLLGASIALGAVATVVPAVAAEPAAGAPAAPLYRLIDSAPLVSSRWLFPPLGLRLESTAGLAPRHELRLSTSPLAGDDYAQALEGVSFATLSSAPTWRLDPLRATYRYTFLERNDWAWKVGVTTNLRALGDGLRTGLTLGQRLRLGTLPQVHFAGEGRLGERWRLAFDADSPTTLRGRSLDLGLRVSYSLSPNFSLYGGYRLNDPAAEGDEPSSGGLANTANVGLRLRF